MATAKAAVKPILEMFTAMIQHPNTLGVLGNWRETMARGMLSFGRKERLSDDHEFNLLLFTRFTPTPSRTGRKLEIDPVIELAGVVTNRRFQHPRFNYLQSEMLIVRAEGRWDYAVNRGFRKLTMDRKVTLHVPPAIDPQAEANQDRYIDEAGKLCFGWLAMSRMKAAS